MTLVLKAPRGGLARSFLHKAVVRLRREYAESRCRRFNAESLLAIAAILCLAPACSKGSARGPVTLTFLDVEWDTPDRLPELAQDLQAFTKQTGIQVKRLPRPDGSLDQLALWRQQLQKGAAAPDLVSIDVIWSAMLSQYLTDLKPYFAAELSSEDPAVLASYSVGDRVVAIPHHSYVGVLYYRPDLLRKYRYDEPPATWDHLESMSKRIQAGERARGEKDFWGYVWQGGVDEDLTCSGLEWQASQGGGRIIEDDRTVSVNNPQTIRAWQRAARWVGSISPPGVVAYSKWDAQNLWGSGRAAFLHGWVSNYSMRTGGWPSPQPGSHTVPDEITHFGVTSVPGGKFGRVSTLGGNGLGVSQGSLHRTEAIQLIRFLLQKDQDLARKASQSEIPTAVRFFQLPVILNPFPRIGQLNRHGGIIVARPSVVAGSKYEEVTRAYIEVVHSVLTSKKASSVAAAELETRLMKITGFPKGQPSK